MLNRNYIKCIRYLNCFFSAFPMFDCVWNICLFWIGNIWIILNMKWDTYLVSGLCFLSVDTLSLFANKGSTSAKTTRKLIKVLKIFENKRLTLTKLSSFPWLFVLGELGSILLRIQMSLLAFLNGYRLSNTTINVNNYVVNEISLKSQIKIVYLNMVMQIMPEHMN